MREEPEEQDFETPLRDLESEDPQLEERLEQQGRDNASVRSDFESAQTDSAVPGAQESEGLKRKYGADGDEPDAAVEHGEADEDSDGEDAGGESPESRGEGAPEVEGNGDER